MSEVEPGGAPESLRERAHALRTLGEQERRRRNPEAALRYYEEAVGLYRRADDPLRLAHTVRHLGDIHYGEGRPDLALPCFLEAVDIYRSHPERGTLDFANAIRPLALLREYVGEFAEARRLWQEVHSLYVEVGVEAGIEESARHLEHLGPQPE